MKKTYNIPIRYSETDCMGVVYHANYALYFEDARSRFIADLGFPYAELEKQGVMSPVVDLQISYHKPLRYGDTASVTVWVSKLRATRITYAIEVRAGADAQCVHPYTTGSVSVCIVDAHTFRPISIKHRLPALYQAYVSVADANE